jgi:hypothetical protein
MMADAIIMCEDCCIFTVVQKIVLLLMMMSTTQKKNYYCIRRESSMRRPWAEEILNLSPGVVCLQYGESVFQTLGVGIFLNVKMTFCIPSSKLTRDTPQKCLSGTKIT